MFDLIGDIHGHANELVTLLEQLGYRETSGVFRHPHRTAIFCGDFIDRGPGIRDVLTICRRMCEDHAAQAVIGNHEFNALAWSTPTPDHDGSFLRAHSEKNEKQFKATLTQLSGIGELEAALDWFRTLPLSLDLGALRVVHACWCDSDLAVLHSAAREMGHLSVEFLVHATTQHDPIFDALERVLKGPEMRLPGGMAILDKDGHLRTRARIRWFEPPDGHSFASWCFPQLHDAALLTLPAPPSSIVPAWPHNAPPVFFGHYWLKAEQPSRLAHNVACLDYSVARNGALVAYRFDGEQELSDDKFVQVRTSGSAAVPSDAAPSDA